MADMRASPICLPLLIIAAGWHNRHIPMNKWQCPCGNVVPTRLTPEIKAFGIHCSGAQHTDLVWYGKVVPEFFRVVSPQIVPYRACSSG